MTARHWNIQARTSLIGLSFTALLLASCAPLGQFILPTSTPTPTNTPPPTATATPRPTSTATATATASPSPSPTVRPSATPTQAPPLAGAAVSMGDLPEGFIPFGQDLSFISMQPSDFTEKFYLEQAQPYNFEAFLFMDPQRSVQFLITFQLYPLTVLEYATLGIVLNDDAAALQFLADNIGNNDIRQARLLPGLDAVGDISNGVTTVIPGEPMTLRVDLVVVVHDLALQAIYLFYGDGERPSVDLAKLAKVMDARMAASLPK